MPERLPNAGEAGWQNVLGAGDGANGFLRVSHNDDGTIKSAAIAALGALSLGNNSITAGPAVLRGPSPWIDVTHPTFGADPTGVANSTTAIQAAIDAIPAAGGTVYFPAGTYVVNGTVDLTDRENVRLLGAGGMNSIYFGAPTHGTVWKRVSGTGTMLKWEASAAAQSLRGCGIEGMSFDANALAATAISLKSLWGGIFRDIFIYANTTAGLALNTVNLSGVEDLQSCLFENITVSCAGTAGAKAFTMDSWGGRSATTAGNISFNTFVNLRAYTQNGTAFEVGDSDGNVFISCVSNRSGTAISLDLIGSNAASGHCRENSFIWFQNASSAPINSRGTDAGYTTPAQTNYLLQSRGNSAPVPTIGTGSTLWSHDTIGLGTLNSLSMNGTGAYGLDFNAGNYSVGPIRHKNNTSVLGRKVDNSADQSIWTWNTLNEFQVDSFARFNNGMAIGNATNMSFGTSTGTKFGTTNAQKMGFWGATPVVQPPVYTASNVTTDRTYDANATSIDELADVLGSLIADLKGIGLIG